ncbi:Hypothetical predicted protein [Cloeon dipterum]|uniref:Uncharacterized protein n=2 Tax=Cloeon dipterum TaxID=197152 RepID=A0A8S1DR35_9INSE|nr:Hypothetical predicted protein [Cloeon dipterum]
MTEKLHEYQGCLGRLHAIRDNWSQKFAPYKERYAESGGGLAGLRGLLTHRPQTTHDFSHIYRQKTRGELVRISAAVMGIEFAYSAETAFVSPTLLKIGVAHRHMTLVWGLSPLVGFFLTPILGSLSDKCDLPLGRRRPFIIALSLGVFLGLLLVPNGESLGYWFGDTHGIVYNATLAEMDKNYKPSQESIIGSHPWGVLFTVLGTVLLDFDADACQSPARAYLLDVTQPEDHARGLSTFTIMAGLGGCMGYAMGGINWDATAIGVMLGGHVRAVFTLITFIFIGCVAATVTSFTEIPLYLLAEQEASHVDPDKEQRRRPTLTHQASVMTYGATEEQTTQFQGNDEYGDEYSQHKNEPSGAPDGGNPENYNFQDIEPPIATQASLRHYLLSIVHMPGSMRILCATNLFCWSAHVCYSLYFTDFVGEAVFGGDPQAAEGSAKRNLYEDGVRFGCWGMAMYSLSCACYSLVIDKLVQRFKAKRVYVCGQLVYCTGMSLLALTRAKFGVIIFSWTAGVMYSTLFTMPYLLVAHYHAENTVIL